MQKKVLRKGYRVKFLTWENDGDHYQTNLIDGIQSEPDVAFLVDVGNQFRSRYCRSNIPSRNLGNEDVGPEALLEIVQEYLELHPEITDNLKERFTFEGEMAEDHVIDVIYEDILGYPNEYDYGFCRVVERIDVEYVTEDVYVTDVTENFIS